MTERTIQIEFSPDIKARLAAMGEVEKKVGIASEGVGSTVSNALRFYEWFQDQMKEGYKLQLAKDGQDYVREVTIMF